MDNIKTIALQTSDTVVKRSCKKSEDIVNKRTTPKTNAENKHVKNNNHQRLQTHMKK